MVKIYGRAKSWYDPKWETYTDKQKQTIKNNKKVKEENLTNYYSDVVNYDVTFNNKDLFKQLCDDNNIYHNFNWTEKKWGALPKAKGQSLDCLDKKFKRIE